MKYDPKIILGIDPGYGRMGWAVIKTLGPDIDLIECGCIETEAGENQEKRLSEIANEIRGIFEKFSPDKLIIEKLLFTKNQTTGIGVAEARGVVLAIAGAFDVEVSEIGPKQVKQGVTSYGDASKEQVNDMVCRMLRLDTPPKPDDAADACAIAIAGA